jgi:uncharacterized protein YaaN involved in tellurite resistance
MGDSLKIGKTASTAAKATGLVAPVADSPAPESSALVLVPPSPVAIVDEPQATNAIKLDAATLAKLDRLVASYVVAIASLDVNDPKFESRVADIRTLGDDDIKASSQVSSRLLERPVGSIAKGGLATPTTVGSSLLQLRRQIDALNPGQQGDLFSPRKLLGVIPFGDRLRNYFARYQSSQGHINAIVAGLQKGQTELAKDNSDLEREKENLWQTMERLRQYIYLSQKLDASLTDRISTVEAKDPGRARILKEDMLFYVRQKVQDLSAQLAVSVQGYLSIDVIRRNNLELIRGVDRATTTTVSALRTAVIVAQAMADQKLVLDQVTALNTTTSNLIESTSVMLRQQSAAINEQASSSTIDLEKLQAAFDNIYATMDEIDAFKLKALDTMTQTVGALTTQVNKAQAYLDRSKAGVGAAPGELSGNIKSH